MYIDRQQQETAALPGSAQAVPYWSQLHKQYIFDRAYASGANAGLCSGAKYNGATQHAMDPSTISICPTGFGATLNTQTAANLATINYVGRGGGALNPTAAASVPDGTANNNLQMLSAVLPSATTLLHETFHLVLGNAVTYPPVGEVYYLFDRGNPQIVGLDYQWAQVNPKSYVLAAVAYDYTLHSASANGNRVEFYTGVHDSGLRCWVGRV